MHHITAHDAKARFGQMLDAARREPVTIEKHGRPVAVVMSKEEFDEIETMKLEQLRAEAQKGIDDITHGDFIEVDEENLEQLVEEIMTRGREPVEGSTFENSHTGSR